jgi:hypothetical protein
MGILDSLAKAAYQAVEDVRNASSPQPPQRIPPRQYLLDTSANVILDVNGNGIVTQ